MLQQGLAFKGFSVEATDGRIGCVSDFLFDETTWTLRWLVVETGNWLADRKLLLHPSAIDKVDADMRAVLVKLTREQVEKSPGIGTDEPVSWQMEHRLSAYYAVGPMGGYAEYGAHGLGVPLTDSEADGATDPGDPHLRSIAEITGYDIEASDGAIGHVECFLIDDQSWDIRYLAVDTANWWFGHHVLLSPASVRAIDWHRHRVSVNLTCYKIKGSPPWAPTGLLDRAYENLLHAYYGWPDRAGSPMPQAAPVTPPLAKIGAVS